MTPPPSSPDPGSKARCLWKYCLGSYLKSAGMAVLVTGANARERGRNEIIGIDHF